MIFIDKNDNLNLSNLHKGQQDFVRSNKLNNGIVGGYQSGKSLAGVVKCITHLLKFPNVPIAYYLPKFSLFEDMLVPKFNAMLPALGIGYTFHGKHSKLITDYGEIWMRSMDNPITIVSYSVGYSLVDEIDRVHSNKRKTAAENITARNSYLKYDANGKESANQIDYVCTPEGFAYMHNFFIKKDNDNKALFYLKTTDNQDNLTSSYIENLSQQYTDQQLKAYLDGEFVNLTSGMVYRNYDRKLNNSTRTIQPKDVLHIGMDFNITNMNAVVHVVDEVLIAVDEIAGVYDTQEMIQVIKRRYASHSIVIYPDAAGKARSTSGKSDHQLLRESKFIIRSPNSNPLVKDRVTAMNVSLLNNKGERRYLVNANNCPVLSEALEQQVYKNEVPDKHSGFDHINEAAGYFIVQQNRPTKKISRAKQIRLKSIS
jgi:hypothetical protein